MTALHQLASVVGKRKHPEANSTNNSKRSKFVTPYFSQDSNHYAASGHEDPSESDSDSLADSEHSNVDPNIKSEAQSVPSTPATPDSTPATPGRKSSYRPLIYHCTYTGCTKVYSRPSRLEEHIRSHTNERPFACPYGQCDKAFLRQGHLDHHIKAAHTRERNYACDWPGCDKRFVTSQRLKNHRQTHINKNRYRCTGFPPCDQTFRKHNTLQKHIDVDHLHKKPFPCPETDATTSELCTQGFDTAAGLRSHTVKTHLSRKSNTPFWCSMCTNTPDAKAINGTTSKPGQGFSTFNELQAHIKTQHPPKCPQCQKLCVSQRDLEHHITTHHSSTTLQDRQTHICPHPNCGKGFVKQSNLKTHYRSSHEKRKPFICGETDVSGSTGLDTWDGANACGRGFTAKASLESHVRKFHLIAATDAGVAPQHTTALATAAASASPSSLSKKGKLPKVDAQTYRQHPSTAARLTGAGYVEESGRSIACPIENCSHRFKRDADLRQHVRSSHGLPSTDEPGDEEGSIAEASAELEAVSGGKFWIGGLDDDNDDEDEDEDEEKESWEATGMRGPAMRVSGGGFDYVGGEGADDDDDDFEYEGLGLWEQEEEEEERQLMRDLAFVVGAGKDRRGRFESDHEDDDYNDTYEEDLLDPELWAQDEVEYI